MRSFTLSLLTSIGYNCQHLPSREPSNDNTSEAASHHVPVDYPLRGMGADAAEEINDMGTHIEGERSGLDDRHTGHSFREGAERAGSEPLTGRTWLHESGYGGRGGEPRTSSDHREESEQESSGHEGSARVEPQLLAEPSETIHGDVTMSSMHRTVAGEVLVHHLTQDERMIDPILLARNGRTARTLVKEGPLRLTMMAIAAGGDLPTHSTDGPVSIHVLQGEVLFHALGQDYSLNTGDVLVFAPGVEHSARSEAGVLFLLTVVHAPSAGSMAASE